MTTDIEYATDRDVSINADRGATDTDVVTTVAFAFALIDKMVLLTTQDKSIGTNLTLNDIDNFDYSASDVTIEKYEKYITNINFV